jgi:hypothetical protein
VASFLSGSFARKVGKAMSSVLFLDATLTRDVASSNSPDIDSFDPPAPTQITYTCKANRDTYDVGLIAGGMVQATDVKVLILQTTLNTTPQSGDRLTITGQGGPWSIVPANSSGQAAVSADPANATWQCRARA